MQNRRRPPKKKGTSLSSLTIGFLIVSCLSWSLYFWTVANEDEIDVVQVENVTPQPQPQPVPTPRRVPPPTVPTQPGWSHINVSSLVIADMKMRNVIVNAESRYVTGQGSGVKIGNNLILTDLHVVVDKTTRTFMAVNIEGRATSVAAYDEENDLAILRLSGYDPTPRLDFIYDPSLVVVNQPIATVGNPYGGEELFQTGSIARETYPSRGDDMFVVSLSQSGYGASGSLIYTVDGRPLGIVQQNIEAHLDRFLVCRNLRPIVRLVNSIRP